MFNFRSVALTGALSLAVCVLASGCAWRGHKGNSCQNCSGGCPCGCCGQPGFSGQPCGCPGGCPAGTCCNGMVEGAPQYVTAPGGFVPQGTVVGGTPGCACSSGGQMGYPVSNGPVQYELTPPPSPANSVLPAHPPDLIPYPERGGNGGQKPMVPSGTLPDGVNPMTVPPRIP